MSREDILNDLREILRRDIFENEELDISEDTSSDDVDEWDSFEQINLLTLIEERYSIKFDVEKINEYKTVAKIIDFIIGEQIEER